MKRWPLTRQLQRRWPPRGILGWSESLRRSSKCVWGYRSLSWITPGRKWEIPLEKSTKELVGFLAYWLAYKATLLGRSTKRQSMSANVLNSNVKLYKVLRIKVKLTWIILESFNFPVHYHSLRVALLQTAKMRTLSVQRGPATWWFLRPLIG